MLICRLDGAFIPWAKELWEKVMEKYPTTEPFIPDDVLLPPSFRMEFLTNEVPQKQNTLPGEFDLIVKKNKRITATDHFQDVRHVELTCEAPDFK
jgi:sulfite reductase alpha subunit-like flavoprotein